MKHSRPVDYVARHESFEVWFQSPLGRALLASQRCVLDKELGGLTGARQLQIGLSHRLPLATGTDFVQRIITTPAWSPNMPDGVAVCDSDELPFPTDSIDLAILHHAADFSDDPHQVLREAARVLRGEGVMALVGFNPLGLWGARKLISRHHQGPWGGRFMMRSRMEDWLRLLGFTVESSATYFNRLPVQKRNVAASTRAPSAKPNIVPVGAYYCILARKRVPAPVQRGVNWRKSKVMTLPGAVGASRGCLNRVPENHDNSNHSPEF